MTIKNLEVTHAFIDHEILVACINSIIRLKELKHIGPRILYFYVCSCTSDTKSMSNFGRIRLRYNLFLSYSEALKKGEPIEDHFGESNILDLIPTPLKQDISEVKNYYNEISYKIIQSEIRSLESSNVQKNLEYYLAMNLLFKIYQELGFVDTVLTY